MTADAVTRWFPLAGASASPRFDCVLGEQPRYTVPRRLLAQPPLPGGPGDDVRLAPSLVLGQAADLLGEPEVAQGPVAVVTDPLRGPLPYWLDARSASILESLRAAGSIEALPPSWAARLDFAGLLRSSAGLAAERARADALIAAAAARRDSDGYALLPGVLHPFHLGELRLHVRRLVRLGHMRDGDGQTPLRWVRHDDAALRIFHRGLAGLVGAVAGEPVKPSYVYTAVYHDGAELPIHRDRAQCHYTLSVYLDCLPEPPGEVPWPLELRTSGARVRVYQSLGDGLLFTGMDNPHGRPPLPHGLTVAAAFLHYVPEAFDGPLS